MSIAHLSQENLTSFQRTNIQALCMDIPYQTPHSKMTQHFSYNLLIPYRSLIYGHYFRGCDEYCKTFYVITLFGCFLGDINELKRRTSGDAMPHVSWYSKARMLPIPAWLLRGIRSKRLGWEPVTELADN